MDCSFQNINYDSERLKVGQTVGNRLGALDTKPTPMGRSMCIPVFCFGICSDPKASKITEDEIIDTMIPATTDVNALCHQYEESEKNGLQLFFSTYQSINVIHDFQQKSGLQFDLVICDEAHRTTGVTLAGEDDSNFVRVHDDEYIHAKSVCI